MFALELSCGVEIRSYSLVTRAECPVAELLSRSMPILAAPVPYDPRVDLVGQDLRVTPAVLSTIDRGACTVPTVYKLLAGWLSVFLCVAG